MIKIGLSLADILKISEEELYFNGYRRYRGSKVYTMNMVKTNIYYIRGRLFYRLGDNTGHLPAYDVNTIDTTVPVMLLWAGFYTVIEKQKSFDEYTVDDIRVMVDFANAAVLATAKEEPFHALPS